MNTGFQVQSIPKEKPHVSNVSKGGNVTASIIGNLVGPLRGLVGPPPGKEVTVKALYPTVSKNMPSAQRYRTF